MKKLILLFILFCITPLCFASDLPEPVYKRLKKEFPGINVRFDALVELPDRTQYLPVFPLSLEKVQGDAQIVQTYPKKKTLKEKPDMILFNNNFALLKIIKTTNDNPTVVYYDKMPLSVKLGLLPQDLLVPENLVLPEGLEVLLGNLVIPIKKDDDGFAQFKDFDKYFDAKKAKEIALANRNSKKIKPTKSIFYKKAPELTNKVFYLINFRHSGIEAVNPETSRVEYKIPLPSIPSDFVLSLDKRYLVVSVLGSSKLHVIDLLKNELVKEVELGGCPSSMVLDRTTNLVYIANSKKSEIIMLDMHHMEIKDIIKVKGQPAKMTLSYDRKSLVYSDIATGNVHILKFGEDFNDEKFLLKAKNLSKTVKLKDRLYVIYRDQDYMEVFDTENGLSLQKIYVGEKPLDLKIIDSKAYVLNAGTDSLSVIDLNIHENIKQIPLATGAFPLRMTVLDSLTRGIITTSLGNEYILFDFQKDEIIDRFPIESRINKLIISRKY